MRIRGFRYRIHHLLLLTGTVCAVCASPPAQQYRVIHDIHRCGGYVGTSASGLDGLRGLLAAKLPDAFAEIDEVYLADVPLDRRWLPTISRSDRLSKLWLNRSGVLDHDLKYFAGNPTLWELYLNGNPISDRGLKLLGELPSLERLQLNFTEVQNPAIAVHSMPAVWMLKLRGTNLADAAVAEMVCLPAIRQIDLSRTEISDQALQYLSSMSRLELVSLDDTRTTDGGVQWLHSKLAPNCTVYGPDGNCYVADRYR